jgi:hypothetical protein
VLLCASVFERARFAVDGRAAAALIMLGVVAAGVGFARARPSPDTPRPLSVAYALDADVGRAFWVSDRELGSGPDDALFVDARPIDTLPRFFGEDGALARAATAAPLAVPGPEVTLVGEVAGNGRRELILRVRSPRAAPWLHVFVESGVVLDAAVDDRPFESNARTPGATEGGVWGFRHIGAGAESFELKLVADPAAGPLQLTVVDQSPGIDEPAASGFGPDVMYARSWIAGTTLVRRTYRF